MNATHVRICQSRSIRTRKGLSAPGMLLLLCLALHPVVSGAAPAIGMRVPPPSQRGYTAEAIRESGERGGMLLAAGTEFTASRNQEMGEAGVGLGLQASPTWGWRTSSLHLYANY